MLCVLFSGTPPPSGSRSNCLLFRLDQSSQNPGPQRKLGFPGFPPITEIECVNFALGIECMVEKFNLAFNMSVTYGFIKNKLDEIKSAYKMWKFLMKSTGISVDPDTSIMNERQADNSTHEYSDFDGDDILDTEVPETQEN
ncbi:hypothetical protein YC2023_051277 [Brassica napus]